MRSLMMVGALALALSACASRPRDPAAAVSDTVRSELFVAREAVWRAYFEGDTTRLVQLLPAQMVGMGMNRADIIRHSIGFREEGGRFRSVSFTGDELLVKGDMAVLWSRYRVETIRDGAPHTSSGFATEVFVREGGRWINPHWQLREDKTTP